MTPGELLVLAQQAAPYAVPTIMTGLATIHSKLGKFPIAKVLVKYLTLWPVLRIAIYELSYAIVTTWGPTMPTLEVAEVKELTAKVSSMSAAVAAMSPSVTNVINTIDPPGATGAVPGRPVSPDAMQRKS